jgi:3-oxoadipate enol-lactonase
MKEKISLNSSELLYFTEHGSGPPLLLLHGLMVTGELFKPVIKHLAARHRLIIPDLRGHGQSQKFSPPYTAAQQASDLSRLLDHLNIDSIAVLGCSYGGVIAQQLVLDHPQRCHRLVLVSTYAFNMATFREKLEGHLVSLLIRILGSKRFAKLVVSPAVRLSHLNKENVDWIVDNSANKDTELMLTLWREAMAFDSRSRLTEIRCPTLIIAGQKDMAVPIHHAKMLHDGITDSQLVIVDGTGHSLFWTHTDKFLQIVGEFIGVEGNKGSDVSNTGV